MFDGLCRTFNRNKQQSPQMAKSIPFAYLRRKGERKFCFFSEVAMEEAQLTTAIDIICDGARRETGYHGMAWEIFRRCLQDLNGSISIESDEKGKLWIIEISQDPLAFR